MIIDVHTHINNYHEDRVVSLNESLDKLSQNMKDNKIDYSLVLTTEMLLRLAITLKKDSLKA